MYNTIFGVLQPLSSDVGRQAILSKSFGEVKELELGGCGGVGFGLASTGSQIQACAEHRHCGSHDEGEDECCLSKIIQSNRQPSREGPVE